jgi:hypothetical protein
MVPRAGLEAARHYEYQGFTGWVVHHWTTLTVKMGLYLIMLGVKLEVTRVMNDIKWSKAEKKTARKAFDLAYERESTDLIKKIQSKAEKLSTPEDIWNLHDFMTKEIKNIGKTYDYRYSVLLRVFAQLIRDEWLNINELEGLSEDKLNRINNLIDL